MISKAAVSAAICWGAEEGGGVACVEGGDESGEESITEELSTVWPSCRKSSLEGVEGPWKLSKGVIQRRFRFSKGSCFSPVMGSGEGQICLRSFSNLVLTSPWTSYSPKLSAICSVARA